MTDPTPIPIAYRPPGEWWFPASLANWLDEYPGEFKKPQDAGGFAHARRADNTAAILVARARADEQG